MIAPWKSLIMYKTRLETGCVNMFLSDLFRIQYLDVSFKSLKHFKTANVLSNSDWLRKDPKKREETPGIKKREFIENKCFMPIKCKITKLLKSEES